MAVLDDICVRLVHIEAALVGDQVQLDRIETKLDAVIFKIPNEQDIRMKALATCFHHIRASHKLEAIKSLREATGLGLKEAKDMVEIIMSS